MTLQEEVLNAINSAITGKEWVKFKWEGDYGNEYPRDIRERRIDDLVDEIRNLRKLHTKIKNRVRL